MSDQDDNDDVQSRLEQAAFNELVEGQRLAEFLDAEFRRIDIQPVRWMHAFATLVAGWLVDSDINTTMLEFAQQRFMTDDEKLQHLINEIKELATISRNAKKEKEIDNHGNIPGTPKSQVRH